MCPRKPCVSRVLKDHGVKVENYGFCIEIHNNTTAVLDVHPQKTYWVANNSLLKSGPVSSLVNWFIIGRTPDGPCLMVLPAPEMMTQLGYQEHGIKVAEQGLKEMGDDPDEHYYLG